MTHFLLKRRYGTAWLASTILILAFSLQSCAKEPDMNAHNDQVTAQMETDSIVLGMGCFWGAEKRMSELPGVVDVESGYAGGDAKKVGYYDVLGEERALKMGKSDARNHAEVVKVTFNPKLVNLETVLIQFWENHDPTQGDRQGNDIGSNYRSAIYYHSDAQKAVAEATRDIYQQALSRAGYPQITTEIAPLRNYNSAEEYHQDYLKKNPDGYCGLGGTGVAYPGSEQASQPTPPRLQAADLNFDRQLIVFEAEECEFCKLFKREILEHWQSEVPIATTLNPNPPENWTLEKSLFATPTIVLFEKGHEVSRFTGYNGDKPRFWKWLGFQLLTPEQQRIAFEQGTEYAFTGSHLDEKRPGTFVDPITGAPLFRSDTKFDSGTGWPSFFNPVAGAITEHEDNSHGMRRIEVRSASSGIHLGHVFNDGPPPTYKRYCINGNVLKFVPDEEVK
ncbi:peptide-methionine (S)-S-oxide reductase MsrA [Thiomicrorhabdus sp. zzn3]|uniref:peptide-methionine (S)-S-oxide reductase MsrA n=1 Tax=Thiomicrorhabdus sp. zzn3 TaxID=3039775 RepID=UPI0024365ED0|nr:peptide-methionine (S)-S-oxide reductase MsrA [Thiomicrorhabdus sp. zzn3]MDG6777172.1 peptide-methionine (S)-S-oxide reductase MsrA [Thiomicrorhabdus sp. zzn3]